MRPSELIGLTEELLEAHLDTVEIAGELAPDPEWQAHLDYLRALQRRGQALLAAFETEPAER